MDPLSDVLSLLKPRGCAFRGLDAGERWSIAFPEDEGVKCYAVTSGECWLSVGGAPDPVRLVAGDCVLLPRGLPFLLASDPAMSAVEAEAFFTSVPVGGVATLGGGGAFFGIGGYFEFGGQHTEMLLGMLPPVVHVREEADRASLRWCVERLMAELREPQPGGALVAGHLAQMLLIQALRLHIAEAADGVGWLFALADRRMRAAMAAMHAEPARRWTLRALAREAAMSRSAFALRFRQAVGMSAMAYLARWRMLIAADRLIGTGEPVCTIAPSLGYESESAFSTAFKRVMNCSPRDYTRRARADAAAAPLVRSASHPSLRISP